MVFWSSIMFNKVIACLLAGCICTIGFAMENHKDGLMGNYKVEGYEMVITNDNIEGTLYAADSDIDCYCQNIAFQNIIIDTRFVERFREIWPDECRILDFYNCVLEDGTKFCDIFACESYSAKYLSFFGCNLEIEDVNDILDHIFLYQFNLITLIDNPQLTDEQLRNLQSQVRCYGVSVLW